MDADEITKYFPSDYIAAVRSEAQADAVGAAAFLSWLRAYWLEHSLGSLPDRLPAEFLMGIGLLMRLSRWEARQIRLHIAAGLPSAREVCETVLRLFCGAELRKFVESTRQQMLNIYFDSFVWRTPDLDIQVDLAMQVADDESFLDAMAEFLWAKRNT